MIGNYGALSRGTLSGEKRRVVGDLFGRLNEALKHTEPNYVRMYAIMDLIARRCSMPPGSKSWATFVTLCEPMKKSILEHVMDEETFNEELEKELALLP